jgi:hypothetical protein
MQNNVVKSANPAARASLTTRLWAGEAHAEVEWTVGPIPVVGLYSHCIQFTHSLKSPGFNHY